MILPENYPYLYETHMHTSQGSACGACSGAQMAKAYQEAGYTGIIITDHNWDGNTAISSMLPWREWIDDFTKGYEEAAEWGRQNGLAVFWGYESCYEGTEFLIYGLSPSFLKDHPELKKASVAAQYEIVKAAGGMVVHAHPYREASYIPRVRLFPDFVDAVEGINATHHNRLKRENGAVYENQEIYNQRAVAYAREHGKPIMAGSDMHHGLLFGGGMAFSSPLTDVGDFCGRIMKGDEYLLTDGISWYNKNGDQIDAVKWKV